MKRRELNKLSTVAALAALLPGAAQAQEKTQAGRMEQEHDSAMQRHEQEEKNV